MEKLIVLTLVSEHSELYMTVKLYHNIHNKEAIWNQIGRILGVSDKCLCLLLVISKTTDGSETSLAKLACS